MARYIDADVLHIKMEDLYEHHIEMKNFSADGAVADCLDLLEDTPTADVVEVVRCKDCEHSYFIKSCSKYECRKDGGVLKYSTDFCSYGKRRMNDTIQKIND
jgi:hypothetical protein